MPLKEIILLIKVMNGGGAERVLSLLANHFHAEGHAVTLVITHQSLGQADLRRVDKGVQIIALEDELPTTRYDSSLHLLWARFVGKLNTLVTGNQNVALVGKYAARNHAKVKWLKHYFRRHKHATLIAFLYDTIFLTLLSRTPTNRVIISERGDPCQSIGSRTDRAFFKTMFPKANAMVFQSPDAQQWYRENVVGIEGTVIFNPITASLPEPFHGKRSRKIVNFCRINPQKNLDLLVEAFTILHQDYPEYELWIYGDSAPNDAEYLEQIQEKISSSCCSEAIHLMPSLQDIHSIINDAAMFVSSSDFEGMSNSMLEAMAIGLPVVCTDCPAGGARAVIHDHENGLLVPIKDANRLYLAMKEIIEKPELAEKLSTNATKVRNAQSQETIMREWESIIATNNPLGAFRHE